MKLRLCTVFILRLVVSVSPLCNLSHQERFRSSDSFRSMLMFPILHLMESVFPGFEAIPKKALAVWIGSVVARIFPRNFMFFLDQSR